jgi:uncharacterized protein
VLAAGWHLPTFFLESGFQPSILVGGLLGTVAVTFWYSWLFNRTGGSVLLAMVFHIAQGTVSYGALGFAGADAARMDWLVGALWFVLALGVVVLDRAAWRNAPTSAVADRPVAVPAR